MWHMAYMVPRKQHVRYNLVARLTLFVDYGDTMSIARDNDKELHQQRHGEPRAIVQLCRGGV